MTWRFTTTMPQTKQFDIFTKEPFRYNATNNSSVECGRDYSLEEVS